MSLPPQNYVRPPRCYYGLYEIKVQKFVAASNTMRFVSKFVRIHRAVLEIKHADVRTDGQT
jgi:hypothetical protein